MFEEKEHTRNYPFRNPLRTSGDEGNDWPLYARFLKRYVWPNRWTLLLALCLLSMTSVSSYLMSYITRRVVDDILMVKTTGGSVQGRPAASTQRAADQPPRGKAARRIMAGEHVPQKNARQEHGRARLLDFQVAIQARGGGAGMRLFGLALLFVSLQIGLNFCVRLSARKQIVVSQAITAKLREDMHEKVMALSMSYHQAMSPGRLLSRILSDVTTIRNELMNFLRSVPHCVSMIIVGGGILLFQDWRVFLMAFCITPVYAMLYRRRRPRIRRLNLETIHTNACLYGLVSQKIDAIKAVQSYARERGESLAFHRLIACNVRDSLHSQRIAAGMNFYASVLTALSGAGIFLFCGYQVLHGQMTLGKMLFVHATTMTLFQPVLEFAQLPFILQRLRIALLRANQVLTHRVEIADLPGAVEFPAPLRKGIQLDHVYFTYPEEGGAREAEEAVVVHKAAEPVLRGVNLFVPAGEWLCVMGSSGSGKSTLLKLLAHLYEPTFGHVRFDGVDLTDIRLASLRKNVGFVPQEAQIFSGSMRDNICYGRPDATNRQILEAVKAAQMHEFIMGMKVQYETLIGQKGASLSGGQRQRLSLARALLTNPSILLLDDCTSALDANTERRIQETLAQVLKGKTVVMVSQRVTMAMRCHKIAVLDHGTVSEYGTHEELLAAGGFYTTLFREQTE